MSDEAPGRISVEPGWIAVQHTGELTLQGLKASRQAAAALAAERRLSRILVDLTRAASSSLTTPEIFELGATVRTVLSLGTTVAVVYRPDQVSTENARLAEMVNENRGVTLRAFSNLEAGRRWLSTRPKHESRRALLRSVRVDEGRGIVWIEPVTSEDLSVSFFGNLETAREKRPQRVLIDTRRMEKAPRLVAILSIILMSPEDLAVALLCRAGQMVESELQVTREAITNLAKQVRIFTDEAAAVHWLEAGE
jgi:hypothetical protein